MQSNADKVSKEYSKLESILRVLVRSKHDGLDPSTIDLETKYDEFYDTLYSAVMTKCSDLLALSVNRDRCADTIRCAILRIDILRLQYDRLSSVQSSSTLHNLALISGSLPQQITPDVNNQEHSLCTQRILDMIYPTRFDSKQHQSNTNVLDERDYRKAEQQLRQMLPKLLVDNDYVLPEDIELRRRVSLCWVTIISAARLAEWNGNQNVARYLEHASQISNPPTNMPALDPDLSEYEAQDSQTGNSGTSIFEEEIPWSHMMPDFVMVDVTMFPNAFMDSTQPAMSSPIVNTALQSGTQSSPLDSSVPYTNLTTFQSHIDELIPNQSRSTMSAQSSRHKGDQTVDCLEQITQSIVRGITPSQRRDLKRPRVRRPPSPADNDD